MKLISDKKLKVYVFGTFMMMLVLLPVMFLLLANTISVNRKLTQVQHAIADAQASSTSDTKALSNQVEALDDRVYSMSKVTDSIDDYVSRLR